MLVHIKEEIRLHVEEGLSVYQIANILKQKPNTVLCNLRNHKVLKKSLGLKEQEKIAEWFEDKGHDVVRQRGDCRFDLLIHGHRVDIKTAHLSYVYKKIHNIKRYCFELKHKKTKNNEGVECDYYILAFLDEPKIPMYLVVSNALIGLKKLSIRENLISKYPLKLIGYLE